MLFFFQLYAIHSPECSVNGSICVLIQWSYAFMQQTNLYPDVDNQRTIALSFRLPLYLPASIIHKLQKARPHTPTSTNTLSKHSL